MGQLPYPLHWGMRLINEIASFPLSLLLPLSLFSYSFLFPAEVEYTCLLLCRNHFNINSSFKNLDSLKLFLVVQHLLSESTRCHCLSLLKYFFLKSAHSTLCLKVVPLFNKYSLTLHAGQTLLLCKLKKHGSWVNKLEKCLNNCLVYYRGQSFGKFTVRLCCQKSLNSLVCLLTQSGDFLQQEQRENRR